MTEEAKKHDDTCECDTHGTQRAAIACQHLVDTGLTQQSVGFFTPSGELDDPSLQAWCFDCEQVFIEENEEFTERMLDQLNLGLVCELCFEEIKTISQKLH